MRDLIKIAAAGTVLTAYVLLAPTLVEAVPSPAAPTKAFTQRLPQAGGAVPVSARFDGVEPVSGRVVVARRPLLLGTTVDAASR